MEITCHNESKHFKTNLYIETINGSTFVDIKMFNYSKLLQAYILFYLK